MLNVFQANYLSVEEKRMGPQSHTSVAGGRKMQELPRGPSLSKGEGKVGTGLLQGQSRAADDIRASERGLAREPDALGFSPSSGPIVSVAPPLVH